MKSLFLGIIIISILVSCNKDDENPDYSQPTGNFIDKRDGKIYKWVNIDNQIWMAENLTFKVDTGGCWAYKNDMQNASTYGYLYNWQTAKAATPEGWHLPSSVEWILLFEYLEEHGYSIDSSGLSFLPGGYLYNNSFGGLGSYGGWWSATDNPYRLLADVIIWYPQQPRKIIIRAMNNGYYARYIKD